MVTALVTGGNRGIGRAAVKRLAGQGFSVWLGAFPIVRAHMALLALAASLSATVASAACFPPPGFVHIPAPAAAPNERLVWRAEDIDIDRPLSKVMAVPNKPLAQTIRPSKSLPGVAGDYMHTPGGFGAPGSRRLNCLTDGSTLEEQVLEREQTPRSYRFRYVVWHFTTRKAPPIVYGVGEFRFTAEDARRTHIHWTYAFQLDRTRFPGALGPVGDVLFHIGFLDRQYAAMMHGVLAGYKADAEAGPPG
jgi:hypothetical protein